MTLHEQAWEAMGRCIGTKAREIAAELGRNAFTVIRWKEDPTGFNSGKRSPLETLKMIIRRALELKTVPREDALAPIHWLAGEFGLIVCEAPETKGNATTFKALLRATKEYGDVAAVASKALEDNKLSKAECREIVKEIDQLVSAAVNLKRSVIGAQE